MTRKSRSRHNWLMPHAKRTDRQLDQGVRPEYRRERPRADSEAAFLIRIGTPEHRIGPVVSDERAAEQLAGLIQFARRLRATSGAH